MKNVTQYKLGSTKWMMFGWESEWYFNSDYDFILKKSELIELGAVPSEEKKEEYEEIESLNYGEYNQPYPLKNYAVKIAQLVNNQNILIKKVKELEDK
jgi:hypothetical protein